MLQREFAFFRFSDKVVWDESKPCCHVTFLGHGGSGKVREGEKGEGRWLVTFVSKPGTCSPHT